MTSLMHQTTTQGRRTVVFGMPWYTVSEDESPRKAALAFAKESQIDFDLLVVRKEGMPQFGVASSGGDVKSGAFSAAAIVADIVPVDSWIYVLEIESSVWICSGRYGFILPDGDQVYSSRDAARAAFQELGPSSFQKIYLPASWKQFGSEANGAEETSLHQFIEFTAPKWGRLSSLSPVSSVLKTGATLIFLGAAGYFGYTTFLAEDTSQTTEQWTPEQLARMLEERRQQDQAAKDRQAELQLLMQDRPWISAPAAEELFAACLQGIGNIPANPVGYAITAIHCDGRSVDAAVDRTTGYSTWLEEWASARPELSVSTSTNGDSGYISRALEILPARGPEEIRAFAPTSRELLTSGQIDGASISLTTPSARPIPQEPDLVPLFASSNYRIETRRPDAWHHFFAQTPGVTIKTVSYSIATKLYTIEGEIYVPNQ